MQFFSFLLRGFECSHNLRILHDGVVADGAVDFHQVLINDPSCADIEVSHFGVPHLSIRESYILPACLQLRMRIFSQQRIPMRRWRYADDIGFTLVTDSPAVQNH